MQHMTVYLGIATLAYIAMVLGVLYRRKRALHLALMHGVIVTDLTLVLVIEFQRSAINTVLNMELNFFQQAHVLTSTLAVLCYLPLLWLGWKLVRGAGEYVRLRVWHKRLGWLAFVFRTLGFLLMFSMLERVQSF